MEYVPLKALQSDNTDEHKTGEVLREDIPPLPLPLNSNWNVKGLINCSNSWIQYPGPRILDAGTWIQGSWIQGPGSWLQDSGSRILDPGWRAGILDTGPGIQGSGSTTPDQGLELFFNSRKLSELGLRLDFGVQGLGARPGLMPAPRSAFRSRARVPETSPAHP